MADFPPKVIEWVLGATGSRLLRVEPLPPGSTIRHGFEIAESNGSIRRVVLRQYHDAKRLARDPWYKPDHSCVALILLAGSGLPVPRLYAEDLHAEICGVPSLVESWIPGGPAWQAEDLDAYLEQAAAILVGIHAVDFEPRRRYAPYREGLSIASPPFSTRTGLWERVADVLAGPPPEHKDTVIHRDYHPGNVLWDGSEVTGVVDWDTFAYGPPGIDLARMRLNLALHYGREVANRFVSAYIAAGGDEAARHPYWDLLDAADLLPEDVTEAPPPLDYEFGRLESYVESLCAEIGLR